jgi:hypothetical protein
MPSSSGAHGGQPDKIARKFYFQSVSLRRKRSISQRVGHKSIGQHWLSHTGTLGGTRATARRRLAVGEPTFG